MERHDVVIVGAGPGGSTTAHYLAREGVDVLLLDQADFPREKTCGDGLTPRALGVLADLGALDDLLPAGRPIHDVEVVGPRRSRVEVRLPRPASLPSPALVVPRRVLDECLRQRAVAAGARFEGRARVTRVETGGPEVVVRGERGGAPFAARARLAVVATGASAALPRQLGLLRHDPTMMIAARVYLAGLDRLPDRFIFRFDDIPLPGYGWVFPMAGGVANVGVGFIPGGRFQRDAPATARIALDRFLRSPALAPLLDGARPTGPVRGYAIRVDFPTGPTSGPGVLLVGEAAGLANPLTGEGVDYALESGRIAAGQIVAMLREGDLSPAHLARYDASLRRHFGRLFAFSEWTRRLGVNPLVLDHLVRTGARFPRLAMTFSDIVLGLPETEGDASLGRITRLFAPGEISTRPERGGCSRAAPGTGARGRASEGG